MNDFGALQMVRPRFQGLVLWSRACVVPAAFVGLLAPGLSFAQITQATRLAAPSAVSVQQFSEITSIRELKDGRVLIADRREQLLAVLDWGTGRAATIGRSGEGPGEYQGAGWLFGLAGDSTLFVEWPFTRKHFLDSDRIVATLPAGREFGGVFIDIAGSDTVSHILGIKGVLADRRPVSIPSADSLLLLLVDRRSEAIDTIAVLKGRGGVGRRVDRPSGNRPGLLISANPLTSEEQGVLFPDGWTAVARLDPYRVDWRAPSGRWIHGAPLPFESIKVDKKEKCASLVRTIPIFRDRCDPSYLTGWPETIPAFLPAFSVPTLVPAPDGRLIIERCPSTESPNRNYDIVDRSGRLSARLELAPNEALVGFGANSIYSTVTNEVGLQTLRRHPWPRT